MWGCSADSGEAGVTVEPDLGPGKADWAPIAVEHGEMKFSIEPELVATDRDGTRVFVLRGRTNRYVTGGSAWTRSLRGGEAQPLGTYTQVNRRAFHVAFTDAELDPLLSGGDLILLFDTQRADLPQYAAQITVRPRITNFRGADVNALVQLRPVPVDGRVAHRLEGSSEHSLYYESLSFGSEFVEATIIERRRFHFDVSRAPLLDAIASGTPFEISGGASGTFSLAINRIEVRVAYRGLDTWHYGAGCYRGTQRCLEELERGTRDLSTCGSVAEVRSCSSTLGIVVDEASVDAALAVERLSASDASALVGATRATDFISGARAALEVSVRTRIGDWHLDVVARDASLADAADRAAVRSLAFPLDYVEALPLRTDRGVVAAQIAADAFLEFLTTYDFIRTEYERPYERVVAESQAEHVAIIGAIRRGEASEDEPWIDANFTGDGPWTAEFYWLGAYIELMVFPTRDPHVYLEID